MSKPFTTVIFDLGDVLFTWSPDTLESPLSVKTLRKILDSPTWYEFEKGSISEEDAYSRSAAQFGHTTAEVRDAFRAARVSLQCSPVLMEVIRELRESGRTVYAMSNISAPDWESLRTKAAPEEWALFNRVFTSAEAHERKPNIGYYEHVVKETGLEPTQTIFVDDKEVNVASARSFGILGIVFDNAENVVEQLRKLCGDPLANREDKRGGK